MSRIMIAGTGSGSGKTTIVCGLCRCIKDLGRTPSALKCGPDYIDAMFHSRVLKMRTGNLDSWFCDKTTIRTLLAKKEKRSDITVIEGVIHAQLAASNEAVRAALETQVADLRQNLNQAGVKVDAVEVTVASHEFEKNLEQNQESEKQQGERQQEQSGGRRRNLNLSSLDELSGLMTEEETLAAQMMRDNGNSMDVTA